MNFRGVPLHHSNAIILNALMDKKIPESQAIVECESETFEKNPANIASTLYLVFHLQSAYSVREQLTDVFLQMKQQIPEGYLQRCFDDLLLALNTPDSEEVALSCVQHFITHLIRTGRCNIDDLRQKGFPLLHLTCLSHKTASILWLLDQGADVNAIFTQAFSVYTPLSSLVLTNDIATANVLIDRYGANINLGNTTDSAIANACSHPTIPDDFIEHLIEKSGVITDKQLGTVIHELIRTKRFVLLDKVLTQYPIDLNFKYFRRQLLHDKIYPTLTAMNIYSLECVKILKKHGADLTLQFSTSSNLLQFAESMRIDLESKQVQTIARLPSHPKYLENPRYYSKMLSIFIEEELNEDQLTQQLALIEKNLVELDQVIDYLKSHQPAKKPEPTTLEELSMQMRAKWH